MHGEHREGWNEEEKDLERSMRERLEERLWLTSELDIGEHDVDGDGDDDYGNNIGESDMVYSEDVSLTNATH